MSIPRLCLGSLVTRGAIQIGHGVGEAIRGSLGATDLGPHTYSSSGEIAQRGRHEIAQGLARIKGVPTMLPPAPVYDRRHSYPVQQYEQQQSVPSWGRRSVSAHPARHNPSTAASPFEKYYEHPYPVESEEDSGFAGLGAGVNPVGRKEEADRIIPAFVVSPPQPAPLPGPRPYPFNNRHPICDASIQSSSPSHPFPESPSTPSHLNALSPHPTSPRLSNPPPLPPRSYARHSTMSSPDGHLHLSVPIYSSHAAVPATSTVSPQPSNSEPPSPSSSRHRLSNLIGKTGKSMRLSSKGKGKERERPAESNKLRRRRSLASSQQLGGSAFAAPSPSGPLEYPQSHGPASYQSRSAPTTPPPHLHESTLETAGYDIISYDVKDAYPHWPTEEERAGMQASSVSRGRGRLEPVRSLRS
ncbi:hypothetical protein C8J57DRAFT_1250044 [Mycena rebaudengoi]|nr:hypothetical protein C8J57DRAFT_1250044 [Mycena rebaudengoi]